MRLGFLGGLALLAALAFPPEAHAQRARQGGLWAGLGLGGGLSTSSEFSGSERWGGAFYGRIGGVLGQRVRLGAEFTVWAPTKVNGDSPARGNLSLVALLYPSATGPLFLKAGAGLAIAALLAQAPLGGTTTRGANGLGLNAGAGADVRLGASVFLTPNLDVLYQYFPAGQDPSLAPSVANFVLLATLGLTLH